jgi:Undecaprenyl-phosphate glucose phosphotransferase
MTQVAGQIMRAGPGGLATIDGGDGGRPARSTRRWSRQVASDLVVLLDVLAIVIGGFGTWILHSTTPLVPAASPAMIAEVSLAVAIFGIGLFRHAGLYATADMASFPVSPLRIFALLAILQACLFSIGLSLGVVRMQPLTWFPVWLALSVPLIVAQRRLASSYFRRKSAEGLFNSHIAVFGSGVIAGRLREHLDQRMPGISLVGLFDDRNPDRLGETGALEPDGVLEDLIEAGRDGRIDQIIIALPPSADRRISEVASKLEQLPVSIHVCTHIASDLIDASSHKVSSLGPIGMIDVKRKPLADWGRFIKAGEDYLLGAIFLLATLPLMALIALAIKLDDGGPVLFRQKRRGLNHRAIEVLKFRSMRAMPAEEVVAQATKEDPRITRVGRYLRKSSLDELPQLFNVLKGEMSLVGPRPHALVHDAYWGELLERYANRHQVKPGMTGWAQVNGFRGETETSDKMAARVEHDLYYIDNWSLWLDLRILLVTPVFGLAHKNAY